jgi:hypothetical protein
VINSDNGASENFKDSQHNKTIGKASPSIEADAGVSLEVAQCCDQRMRNNGLQKWEQSPVA